MRHETPRRAGRQRDLARALPAIAELMRAHRDDVFAGDVAPARPGALEPEAEEALARGLDVAAADRKTLLASSDVE